MRQREAAALKAAYAAQVAELGPTGTEQVDSVVQWLNAYGGPDAAPLANMFKIAPVASTIRAMQRIMQRVSSQGVTPFSQAHRADAPQGIPGYDKMTFEQRRHAQEQRRQAGAR